MSNTSAIVMDAWGEPSPKIDRFIDNMFKGISNLSDQVQIRDCLRARVAEQLAEGLAIPELIDGLTEYLMELFAQDFGRGPTFNVK